MHAFILAGGFATRLWPLTEKRAKPLLPLAGVPLIEYLVRNIPEGIPITISTNAVFKEPFEQWAATLDRSDVTILIEHTQSDDQKLGALGATAQWIEQEKIDDDILILAGDNYCGFSFDAFLQKHEKGTAQIAVHDIGDLQLAKAFGTVLTEGNTVTAFEEKPKEPKTTLVNTGCYIIDKSMLPVVIEHAKAKPDDIGGIFEELLQRGMTVKAFDFTELWFDIGSFDAYIEATKALVGESVLSDGSIENTESSGSVVVAKGSTVEGSQLSDVVIFEDCIVKDCVLERCVLDRGCHVTGIDLTGKMLRENTTLKRS